MGRATVLQEVLNMRFEDVYGRFTQGRLNCDEASDLLGISVSSFRRRRRRYEDEGLAGLADGRLGKASARRVPVDEVSEMLALFETRYFDFTVKHFQDKLVASHGYTRSYSWTKGALQAHGKITKAPRRGAHRRKRPRRPLPGMMLHQDGSTHQWVAGQWWDLIVTLDDATSEIYSAFFVAEEGTQSCFRAFGEVIEAKGLFNSLYADRAGHYWHTPKAGGKVDKANPTQVGRALAQLGIELIPAYSPEARGRSERMFGTLQNRLPQELRLAGITTMAEANRFLREVYLPEHNALFAIEPEEPGAAFVTWAGAGLADILTTQEERTVGNDNTVAYKRLTLQIPEDSHRHHYVKAKVKVHEYHGGQLAIFHGPRCLARYDPKGDLLQEHNQKVA